PPDAPRTGPGSTGSSRPISSAASLASDGSDSLRVSRLLAGDAGSAGALSGAARDRRRSAPDHPVCHAVWGTAHQRRGLPSVRLSEHPRRRRALSGDLLIAQLPARPRHQPVGAGQTAAEPLTPLL